MKNKPFLPGILAIALVLGMITVGCDTGINETEVETDGRLTINGIADYNGTYALAASLGLPTGTPPPSLIGAASFRSSTGGQAGLVSNGSVTLKIWEADSGTEEIWNYRGNDQNVTMVLMFYETATISDGDTPVCVEMVTVNFTNGIASVTIGSGSLTINTIPDEYNGKYLYGLGTTPSGILLIAFGNISFIDSTITAGLITGGSCTLKVYTDSMSHYTGNDQNVTFILIATDNPVLSVDELSEEEEDDSADICGMVTVSFTNGIATGTFTTVP